MEYSWKEDLLLGIIFYSNNYCNQGIDRKCQLQSFVQDNKKSDDTSTMQAFNCYDSVDFVCTRVMHQVASASSEKFNV